MRSQDDPVRIRCGLAVDEKEELAVAALVGKTRFRQADTPNGEELRERIAPDCCRLDVHDTARVVGVKRRDESIPDADPGRDDDRLADDEDVEMLMGVERRSRPGRKTERVEPRA
jgi:hypothetical protein